MATGFITAQYFDDDNQAKIVKVEADRYADGAFAWTAAGAGAQRTGYGSTKPRHVAGLNAATGKRATAVVPDLAADVWTGTSTDFVAKDDDGVSHTFVITARVGEVRHYAAA